MTPFQTLSISVLAVLFLRELMRIRKETIFNGNIWLRSIVWFAAAAAIFRPQWVQAIAETAGIDRGADLVVYLFVLAFVAVSFYFYSRQVQTQRQITHIVRHLAMQEARRGSS